MHAETKKEAKSVSGSKKIVDVISEAHVDVLATVHELPEI